VIDREGKYILIWSPLYYVLQSFDFTTSQAYFCIWQKIIGFSNNSFRTHISIHFRVCNVSRGRLQDITSLTSWSPFTLRLTCNSWVPTAPERNAKAHFVPDTCRAVWSSGAFRYPDAGITCQVRRYRWAIKVLQPSLRPSPSRGT